MSALPWPACALPHKCVGGGGCLSAALFACMCLPVPINSLHIHYSHYSHQVVISQQLVAKLVPKPVVRSQTTTRECESKVQQRLSFARQQRLCKHIYVQLKSAAAPASTAIAVGVDIHTEQTVQTHGHILRNKHTHITPVICLSEALQALHAHNADMY
jgi:hypothetical protein